MTSTSRAVVLLLLGCATTGCMAQYKPPTAQQPHAVVKFRRTYETTAGSSLTEVLVVDDTWAIRKQSSTRDVGKVHTDAVLLHPGDSRVELHATFSHQESRSQQESYSCGTSDSPRTCYRTVQRVVTVVDGACNQPMGIRFRAGSQYLLQMTYQDGRNCSASCLIQEKLPDGTFENSSCTRLPELLD